MSTDPISKYHSNGTDYCTARQDSYPFIAPEQFDMSGRYVLITGASRGIGHEIARSFAAAGASGIAIGARSSLQSTIDAIPAAAAAAGKPTPKIVALDMDVASKDSVSAAAETVRREFGGSKLDVIVLNAGLLEPNAKIGDQDADTWWQSWQVNMLGSFLTIQAFLPQLLATERGLRTVVGLSSIGATLGSPGLSAYQPSKLALCRLLEHLNNEYGKKQDGGVLGWSVHPGGVLTDMGLSLPKWFHEHMNDSPKLAADVIVFLSQQRRDWLAGRYISCTWDMQEFLSKQAEIEKRDLLRFRLPMGGEDWSKA